MDARPGATSIDVTAAWCDRNHLVRNDFWPTDPGLMGFRIDHAVDIRAYSRAADESVSLEAFEQLPWSGDSTWIDEVFINTLPLR